MCTCHAQGHHLLLRNRQVLFGESDGIYWLAQVVRRLRQPGDYESASASTGML